MPLTARAGDLQRGLHLRRQGPASPCQLRRKLPGRSVTPLLSRQQPVAGVHGSQELPRLAGPSDSPCRVDTRGVFRAQQAGLCVHGRADGRADPTVNRLVRACREHLLDGHQPLQIGQYPPDAVEALLIDVVRPRLPLVALPMPEPLRASEGPAGGPLPQRHGDEVAVSVERAPDAVSGRAFVLR